MPKAPSTEIPFDIKGQDPIFNAVLDWFDSIWFATAFPTVDNLYQFTDYRAIDDDKLDFLLYDKGFSTSPVLVAEQKRCLLENWIDLYRLRHTPAGFQKLLECYLGSTTNVIFERGVQRQYLQPNSSTNSFGNSTMLASAGSAIDFMTYIFHPSFEVRTNFSILFDYSEYDQTILDGDFMTYLNNLLPLDLPLFSSGEVILVVVFFRALTLNVEYTITGPSEITYEPTSAPSGLSAEDILTIADVDYIFVNGNLVTLDNINGDVLTLPITISNSDVISFPEPLLYTNDFIPSS